MSPHKTLLSLVVLAGLLLIASLMPTQVSAQGGPTVDITTASNTVKAERGSPASTDVVVFNKGTTNISVDMNATGELAKAVSFSNTTFNLTPGANQTVKVTFKLDSWIDTGEHPVTIAAVNHTSSTDRKALDLTVNVVLPSGGASRPDLFILALLPLIIVLIGIAAFKQSGTTMAIIGLIVCIALAVGVFRTDLTVALQAAGYGFVKSFGISIAVITTMYMIFLMAEMGLLKVISAAIKKLIVGQENMSMFIGIGFGSFLTCLGVTTPAMFPPVLIAMGYSPAAAVAIAVLGYNATTSFALLSIPITLPAEIGGIDPIVFAYKISLFLPVISVVIALTILWMVGGKKSVKKGLPAALVCSLTLAFACLGFSYIDLVAGKEIIPISIMGVLGGLLSMGALLVYQKAVPPKVDDVDGEGTDGKKKAKGKDKGAKDKTADKAKDPMYTRNEIARAFSPWIILTIIAAIISVPAIATELKKLPGDAEVFTVWENKSPIDLDVLNQIYFWIFISIIITIILLRPSKELLGRSFKTWLKRMWSPFLAFSLYFSIAYVMAYSAYSLDGSNLVKADDFNTYNMNSLLGATLAIAFGAGYIFVAAGLGLFGAVVGGSETSSNVMFYGIQRTASVNTGLKYDQFLTVFGAHAAAGGIASAITPAKINNAVSTIGETSKLESEIMRKHMVVTILLTIGTSIMTGIFVMIGL